MASDAESSVRGGRGPGVRWLTATAWASMLIFSGTATLVSVPLKQIGDDLQIGFAERGLLAPSRSVMLALATLSAGYLADRFGKRWFLGGGLCIVALGLLWTGATGTYPGLLVGMMAIGCGLGPIEGLASPLIAELHPRAVATQMNVLHAFYSAGLAAASLLMGVALDRGTHWRTAFPLAAVPALLVGIMFAAGRYRSAEDGPRPAPLPVREILRSRAFWPLAAAMALTAGCEGSLTFWSPNFIQAEYGASALVGSYGLAVFAAAMTIGRFATGAATRFVSLPSLMVALALAGAGATLCLALVRSLSVSLGAFVLGGLCIACFWPCILSLATSRMAAGSATLLAMLSVAGIAGFGGVPLLIGLAAEWGGLRAGLLIVPAGLLAAVVALKAASGKLEPVRR